MQVREAFRPQAKPHTPLRRSRRTITAVKSRKALRLC
jgi:hypothetical protein